MVAKTLLSMVAGYATKLASKEFLHWALMRIAKAIVESTETKEDDAWYEKISKTLSESGE